MVKCGEEKNIPLSHFVPALPEGEPKSSKKASPFRRGGCEADGEVVFRCLKKRVYVDTPVHLIKLLNMLFICTGVSQYAHGRTVE